MSCVLRDWAATGPTFVMITQATSNWLFVITLLLALKRLTVAGQPALTIYCRCVVALLSARLTRRLDTETFLLQEKVFERKIFFFFRSFYFGKVLLQSWNVMWLLHKLTVFPRGQISVCPPPVALSTGLHPAAAGLLLQRESLSPSSACFWGKHRVDRLQ